MSKERTLKGKLGDLQQLLSSLNANSADLAHLEATRIMLGDQLAKAQEAIERQGVHRAAKQEASQEFQAALTECERLANILRLGVKQHYGIRAEKLAEFGLLPFRGKKAAADAEPPQPPPPNPPTPGPE